MNQYDREYFNEFIKRRCGSIDRHFNGMLFPGSFLIVSTIGAFGLLYY